MGVGFGYTGLVWSLCIPIAAGANTVVEASSSAHGGATGSSVGHECEPSFTTESDVPLFIAKNTTVAIWQ